MLLILFYTSGLVKITFYLYMFVEIIFWKTNNQKKTTGSLIELPAVVDHAGLKVGRVVRPVSAYKGGSAVSDGVFVIAPTADDVIIDGSTLCSHQTHILSKTKLLT